MVHKKYIKKDGKVFGPYFYENHREKGITKTKYLGKVEKKSHHGAIFLFMALLVFLVIVGSIFFSSNFTGRVLLKISDSFYPNETITGNLKIGLKYGELLPAETQVLARLNRQERTFLLSDLISSARTNGTFFVENSEISGEGEGYGTPGEKKIYPKITFSLKITSGEEETSGTGSEETTNENATTEEVPSETPTETPTEEVPITETPSETPTEEAPAETPSETTTETPTETPAETPSEASSEASSESSAPITGETISESIIDGIVDAQNPYYYDLQQGEHAEVVPGSVEVDGEKVDYTIGLEEDNENRVVITTDYYTTEEGFGQDYLINKTQEITINIKKLNLSAEEGSLSVSLSYNGENLVEGQADVNVINETEENATTLIELNQTNITAITNETNVTVGNMTVTTKQYQAVIGKPVKWVKKVTIEGEGNLSLDIPKTAENITVKTGEEAINALEEADNSETQVDRSVLAGNVVLKIEVKKPGILTRMWGWLTGAALTGKTISEEELGNSLTESEGNKTIDLGDVIQGTNETEVSVEYYTEAPQAFEENITDGKRVVVSAPDELGYTDVLAYSELDNSIPMGQVQNIKLYWYPEEGKEVPESYTEEDVAIPAEVKLSTEKQSVEFDAYDLDEDGNVDYIEWVVPHLSSQVYEIIYITKAVRLDENRNFVEDIYDYVKTQDNNFTTINSGEYVRVTFEQLLDNTKDITLYARAGCNGTIRINDINVPCEIYYKKLKLDSLRRENG